ncbi:MAG: glycosyltransferase family 9 protein [Planctomycetota bacterium]
MNSINMKPSYYREKFIALQKTTFDRNALSQLAKQTANSFMDYYYRDGSYHEGYIDLMCEMATFFPDKELNRVTSSAFFSVIIEALCDDYEDFQFEAYNRVMSQVISYCRNVPSGKKLDQYLNNFNLFSAEDIFRRAAHIQVQKYRFNAETKGVKRIFFLSRITIGADVAIMSVMIQRLSMMFPDAEIIILGSLKLKEIFGGNPRIRTREVTYIRKGSLLERLESWCRVVDILKEETATSGLEATLLIDTDSRIAQLGMLPIFEEENYLYFSSHHNPLSAENACMAELTNAWIDKVFGQSNFCYPRIWLEPKLLNLAQRMRNSLLQSGCQMITTVNFGVGGNPRKRLGLGFEKKLICELLKKPKSVVILDKGFGAEELKNSQEIIEEAKSKGYTVREAELKHGKVENFSHGLLVAECSIGQISALIGSSDEFIGYDSACQHIAAAISVPTVTVFVGSNNPRFIRRWKACGNTSCKVVHVNTFERPEDIYLDEIINRIMSERLLKTRTDESKIKIVGFKSSQLGDVEYKDKLEDRTL